MEDQNENGRANDDREAFQRRKAGGDCPMCPDANTKDMVARLKSGAVHLQTNGDYPGYCILVCHRHAVELYDLTVEEQANWIEDIAAIGKAIAAVCEPAKLNLFMLGNMVPHLHCHIMPRYFHDPEWGGAPSLTPNKDARTLSQEEFSRLFSEIRNALSS